MATRRQITFVKKIKADGSLCRKCADVQARLEKGGHLGAIDRVVIADERDPASEGMQLAAALAVSAAPFFVVDQADGSRQVYTSFFRFLKDVLGASLNADDQAAEGAEIIDQNPDLDFI